MQGPLHKLLKRSEATSQTEKQANLGASPLGMDNTQTGLDHRSILQVGQFTQ